MQVRWTCRFVLICVLAGGSVAIGAEPAEPLLKQLPAGLVVQRSVAVPAAQIDAFGKKLGGTISSLTNSHLLIHGRPVQVNVITAADDGSANAIYQAISRLKQPPYLSRKGRQVIEYVGANLDDAVAIKASYELGLVPKPQEVRYRVIAELATIDEADYMSCNLLLQQFLNLRQSDAVASQKIQQLAGNFKFGKTLVLRSPRLATTASRYQFDPPSKDVVQHGSTVSIAFASPPARQSIPFVTATLEVTAAGSGRSAETAKPGPELLAATRFWPVDDPAVRKLAQEITTGNVDASAKVQAILQWLSPGKNLKYSGQTGSRWGTRKVFDQRFGHCWDFSDCFVTLARAAGIPCRQVAGWFYGASGHVWAEYHDGTHWQQVDPTGGGDLACGIYHIAYFTSENGAMPIVYLSLPRIETISPQLAPR